MVNLNAVNLNRLVTFVAIVEAGSLTAAAERLGLAKTMVSKHMQLLEAELGVTLLVRSTRRLSLTEAGQGFFSASRDMLHDAEAAIELARGGQQRPRGTLRVAAPVDYGAIVVAPLLVALRRRYPELAVELSCADHLVDLIADGIDVAVRLGKLADSSHRAAHVGSFLKFLVASPGFLAAHGAPASFDALQRLPYIGHSVLPQPLAFALAGPGRQTQDVKMARAAFSSNTVVACRAAVLAGEGVALMSDFSVHEDLAAGRLVRLMPQWATAPADVHAVFPATPHQQQKVRVFIDALQGAAGRSCPESEIG